jgi:probable F420-dependent oxidoreductase
MEIGIYGMCTDETLRPDEVARLVEDAGFDALAFGEHTHIPVRRETPYAGGELPRDFTRMHDLLITLTAAALATRALRVSSSILQLAQRDPISTAKAAASLDVLSGGRLDLIVGHGWNLEEIRNHGIEPAARYDVVRERMLAMRAIWQNDEAAFSGEHVSFDALWSWPKPLQPGGVPLLLRGNAPGSEERALAYSDGWAPISAPGVLERVGAFAAANPGVPLHVGGVASDPGEIEAYANAGASRVILGLGAAHPAETERTLEHLAGLVRTAVG